MIKFEESRGFNKIIFLIGVFLLLTIVYQISTNFIYYNLVKSKGYSDAYDWVQENIIWLNTAEWIHSILFLLFSCGVFTVILGKKPLWILIALMVINEIFLSYNRLEPDTFNYKFTPEDFNLFYYLLFLISTLLSFCCFTYVTLRSKDMSLTCGLALRTISCFIWGVFCIGIGVIFSLDSTYFGEKFPTFFLLRDFCSKYLAPILDVSSLLFIQYFIYHLAFRDPTVEELLDEK